MRRQAGLLAGLLLALPVAGAGAGEARDAIVSVPAPYDPGELRYPGTTRRSFHLPMRDRVRIAVDLRLPEGLEGGERLPTILLQTRYWRSTELRWPLRALFDRPEPLVEAFVRRGYAWVSVDARGSGASFGSRPHPWSADEVRDGAEIVDWVIAQPWSNGKVGSFGTSYDGTTAEFLAANGHPAVVAVAPRFSLFDAYADIAFPGGVHLTWFTENWGRVNASLDRNAMPPFLRQVFGWRARLARGVRPVDGDGDRRLLAAAVRDHSANWDVHATAVRTTFRDDPDFSGDTVDVFSPFAHATALDASPTAIFGWSGWFDGGYAHAAIKRHLTLRNADRLLIGPWDHGGRHHVRGGRSHPTRFDHESQLLKFFDRHLKGKATGLEQDAPVHYYTLVEGRWKAAAAWPPPARGVRWYLAPDGGLVPQAPSTDAGADDYRVDFTHGTGERSRWNSLMGLPVFYPDRAQADGKLLVYQSAPLERDVEVTGHAVATLYVASDAEDGAFFVYLEDVGPDGSVTYVTEGGLRALHRKLATAPPPYRQVVPLHSFRREDARPLVPGEVTELVLDLLPTSYLFRAGHAIRIALAGADADHFARIPAAGVPTWRVHRSRAHPSHVLLPVVSAQGVAASLPSAAQAEAAAPR